MAIKSHTRRNSIGRKVFMTNLATLGITLSVVFLAFTLLVPVYFRHATRAELKNAGIEIIKALDTIQTLKADTADDRRQRLQLVGKLQEIRIAGRMVNARMALVDANGDIRLTNIVDLENQALRQVISTLDAGRSAFVYVRLPFQSADTGSSGALYLFALTEDVSAVNRGVLGVLMGSLLLGGAIAFVLGLIQERRIRKPLDTLVRAVENFSPRTFQPVHLNSNDELQTLAEAFNTMAEALKQSDEMQIRLLQDISHELKTPLMSVQGYAEAIQDGFLSGPEAHRSLGVIIDESQRLKRLVEELLLLSRLENQSSSYNMVPCQASETVRHAIDAAGGYARERNIAIQLIEINDFIGLMDQDRMIQCLVNLLGNGIRYAVGEIRVTLDGEGILGSISIVDDGMGFSPGEAEHIFDRFYKGPHGEAGIGLTIARTIAEKHGGTIIAGNREKGGAEFILHMPITGK